MANALLEGRIKRGETVRIQLRQKEICFTPVSEEKKAKQSLLIRNYKKAVKSWTGYWSKKVVNVIIKNTKDTMEQFAGIW